LLDTTVASADNWPVHQTWTWPSSEKKNGDSTSISSPAVKKVGKGQTHILTDHLHLTVPDRNLTFRCLLEHEASKGRISFNLFSSGIRRRNQHFPSSNIAFMRRYDRKKRKTRQTADIHRR
jgi:hypothetical protein